MVQQQHSYGTEDDLDTTDALAALSAATRVGQTESVVDVRADAQILDLRDRTSTGDATTDALVKPEILRSDVPIDASLARRPTKAKRLLDVVLSGAALVVGLPVLAAVAVAVKLTSKGPVFYHQTRVGLDGEHFECMKFRTMVTDADTKLKRMLNDDSELRKEFAADFKLKKDPRITPIGKALRKTSLDELPQLWNVLKGDMSVVGPRPVIPMETARYGVAIDLVLSVRPGLTGVWQVSGRNDVPYAERIAMDAFYARDNTFGADLAIVAKTIPVLALPSRKGAY